MSLKTNLPDVEENVDSRSDPEKAAGSHQGMITSKENHSSMY
jgi:hypothetical protein